MAETKRKKSPGKKSATKTASKTKAPSKAKTVKAPIASATGALLTLGAVKPANGSWPKRTRVGRGHGSGMVKTGGEGGKGQTVRSGGGKGPAFEGGQTPWARRLPHRRGYSQKARDIGHFRTRYAVVKILGGSKTGKTLPAGLRFRDVLFSDSAREALAAAGALFDATQGDGG